MISKKRNGLFENLFKHFASELCAWTIYCKTSLTFHHRQYPGEYWRELERRSHGESRYPVEFVEHLQRDGLLSILIPEKYGGGGQSLRTAAVVLEEIHRR